MAAKKKANALEEFAQSELAKLLGDRTAGLKDLPLFEFLTRTSPHYRSPDHLEPLLPYFDLVDTQPTMFCFSAPPRHAKSVTTNHFVARHMLRHPGVRVAYGCYSLDLSAGFFSDEVKDILTSNGIKVRRDRNTKEEWELENGSSFKAVAPGSGFTGRGADLILVDDPFKNRQAAESGKIREETQNWVRDVCITRRSPKASVICTHTRWHAEDTIGILSRDFGVPYVNLPAVNQFGHALWPSEWPLERLLETKKLLGEYGWASLYMGSPIPRGGSVFKGTNLYYGPGDEAIAGARKLPERFVKITIGLDMAYSKKTHADYSVALVLGVDEAGDCYVLDMRRMQVEAKDFAKELKELRMMYGNPTIWWMTGGQEREVSKFFRDGAGVPVKDIPAKEDKFVRAQAVAAAWNSNRVFIPSSSKPWIEALTAEILTFTGMDDPHDDIVDALAAAYYPLAGKKTFRGFRGPENTGGFNPFGF